MGARCDIISGKEEKMKIISGTQIHRDMIRVTDCCGLYSKPQRRRAYEMSTQLPQPLQLRTLRSHVKRLDWIGHGMKNAVLTTGAHFSFKPKIQMFPFPF